MEHYFVFDSFEISPYYESIFDAIEAKILRRYREILGSIYLDKNARLVLIRLAKSDRKKFAASKVLSRAESRKTMDYLISERYLRLEKSREEKPTPKFKNHKLPRELRRYIVHDKVQFKSNFMRFWFRFVEPNLGLLRAGRFDEVLEMIRDDFENYASLPFENLSIKLAKIYLNSPNLELYSYWTKEFEVDMFSQSLGGVIGEVKFRDRKVCKNALNLLDMKAQKIGIKPKFTFLFAKSGYSNELLNLKRDDLKLFDLDDFARLF